MCWEIGSIDLAIRRLTRRDDLCDWNPPDRGSDDALLLSVCMCSYFRIGDVNAGISSGAGASVTDSTVRDAGVASTAVLLDG